MLKIEMHGRLPAVLIIGVARGPQERWLPQIFTIRSRSDGIKALWSENRKMIMFKTFPKKGLHLCFGLKIVFFNFFYIYALPIKFSSGYVIGTGHFKAEPKSSV